jgi:PKD repeat protein
MAATKNDTPDVSPRTRHPAIATAGAIVVVAATIINFLSPVGGWLALVDALVWAVAWWTVFEARFGPRWLLVSIRVAACLASLGLLGLTLSSLADDDPPPPFDPPFASARASATAGVAPFRVVFDAADSRAAKQTDPIAYAWDLDGDGSFGDATTIRAVHTYETPGEYVVRVKVTDSADQSSVSRPLTVTVRPQPKPEPKTTVKRESLIFKDVPDSRSVFELTVAAGPIIVADSGEDELSRLVVRLSAGRCEWRDVKTGDRFEIERGPLRFQIDAQHVGFRVSDFSDAQIDITRRTLGRSAARLRCRTL